MKRTTIFLTMLLTLVFTAASAQTTPPSSVTTENWYINYTMNSASYGTVSDTETMEVAFDGNDVFFNFPNPINGSAWIKGTIAGTTATFTTGQSMGTATYGGEAVYMCGINGEGALCDVVFNYDSEKKMFTLSSENYLLINSSATKADPWAYFSAATISKEEIKGGSDIDENGRVVVPTDATVKNYTLTCRNVNPNNEEQYTEENETVQVAFLGSSIYIQGLCGYDPSAWIKGTVSGSTATFAKRQFVTTYNSVKLYMIGYAGSEDDIVFNYNTETGSLQTDQYIFCISEDNNTYQMLTNVALTVQNGDTPTPEPQKPDVVTPPDGLQTSEYLFSATRIMKDYDGSWLQEPIKYNVRVGINGIKVYVQGLCQQLPYAWIEGTRDASDGELSFASGQYYGQMKTPYGMGYDFYFAAANYPTSNPTWIDEGSFSYNSSNGTYSSRNLLTLNSSATEINPYEFYAGAKLVKIADVAATPATPSVTAYTAYMTNPNNPSEGYGMLQLNVPVESTTGEPLLTDKLGYQLYTEQDGQQAIYTFKSPRYQDVKEDMTLVPYNYTDYDFYLGGTAVYFYDDLKDVKKLGVQSVYMGGNERHESEISWYNVNTDPSAISTIDSESTPVSVSYTDLQGRKVSANTKGLVLKTTRMSDGTVKTAKTVR